MTSSGITLERRTEIGSQLAIYTIHDQDDVLGSTVKPLSGNVIILNCVSCREDTSSNVQIGFFKENFLLL